MPADPAGRLAVLAAAGDGAAKAELVIEAPGVTHLTYRVTTRSRNQS